jgi:hypothetical protein
MRVSRSSVEGVEIVLETAEGEVQPEADPESSGEDSRSYDRRLIRMPDAWWDAEYEDLVDEALADPEIASSADIAGLTEAALRRTAASEADEVRSAVSSEWSRLETADRGYEAAFSEPEPNPGFGRRSVEFVLRARKRARERKEQAPDTDRAAGEGGSAHARSLDPGRPRSLRACEG